MLIDSRMMRRGRCPICGAVNCACGGATTTNGVVITEGEKPTGAPLYRREIRPGLSIKVTEAEAIRLGIVPAKKAEPVLNKKRTPSKNKGRRADG